MTNQERDELLATLRTLVEAVNHAIAGSARGHNDGWQPLNDALEAAEEKLEGWDETLS